jgi:IPT/TIG domain
MTGNPLFCLIFSLLLVFSVIFAGCSDESPSGITTTPTSVHPDAKYRQGDIIATASSSSGSSLYLVLKYDAAADEYTRALIEKNEDGTWGHRTSTRTEKSPREVLEKVYTVRVGHVEVSAVPVVTPTVLSVTTPAPSGNAPSITGISPSFASRDTAAGVTITGTNFQDGATVKLVRAGSTPITATGISVSATGITCLFSFDGRSDGSYNLIVINPDGQSDSRQNFFTIGEAPPVITGIYPTTAELNDIVPLSISGQNFRNDVKVTFTKDSTELVCGNPISMDSAKISCNLDLTMTRGATAGEWTVTVLNILSQQKGTCAKKFIVTNSTTEKD